MYCIKEFVPEPLVSTITNQAIYKKCSNWNIEDDSNQKSQQIPSFLTD